MNLFLRRTLALVMLLFAAVTMSTWSKDNAQELAINATMSAVSIAFAVGLAGGRRFAVVLRAVSAVIGIGSAVYFAHELWSLLVGARQPMRVGRPSALASGVTLIVVGVPALVYAIGGHRTGILRIFREDTE